MRSLNLWTAGLVWSSLALAQTEISVHVCNIVQVAERTLKRAEKEASGVLDTGGVTVAWMDCSAAAMERLLGPSEFVLSVRGFLPSQKGDWVPRYPLGETWMIDGTKQTSFSVYYDGVRKFASSLREETQIDQILGCAIAHELGHLFLGPAHTPGGVMQAEWREHELMLMSRRHLKFTSSQR